MSEVRIMRDASHGSSTTSQRGSLIVLVAIILPVLIGMLGLVIDNGYLLKTKREMQSAADAAALAAAHELRNTNYAGYVSSAEKDAALNGFAEADGTRIDVSYPPTSGEWSGNNNYVEIKLVRDAPLYFMRAFGRSSSVVEARAVAGLLNRDVGVYALAANQAGALRAAAGARVDIGDCEMFVASRHPRAAITASGARLEAGRVAVVGGYDGGGFYPAPETGAMLTADPLEDLKAPSFSGCDHTSTVTVDDSRTLGPGVYCGGIDVINDGRLNLRPGVYVLNGGGLRVGGECDPPRDDDRDSDSGHDRDGDSDRDSDGGRDRNGDSDRDSDSGRDRDGDSDSDRDSDSGHDRDGDSDRDSDSGRDRDDDSDRDSDSGRDRDGDSDRDSDSGRDRNGDSDRDSDGGRDCNGDSDRDSDGRRGHAAASNLCQSASRADRDGDSDSDSRDSEGKCTPSISGSGVTFYFTEARGCSYGPLDLDESAKVTLSAPTTGDSAGILFFQDRTVSSTRGNVVAGTSASRMQGVAYFPTTDLKLVGPMSSSTHQAKFVAESVEFQGNVRFECIPSSSPRNPPVMRRTALTE